MIWGRSTIPSPFVCWELEATWGSQRIVHMQWHFHQRTFAYNTSRFPQAFGNVSRSCVDSVTPSPYQHWPGFLCRVLYRLLAGWIRNRSSFLPSLLVDKNIAALDLCSPVGYFNCFASQFSLKFSYILRIFRPRILFYMIPSLVFSNLRKENDRVKMELPELKGEVVDLI